jgi:hypothetical protein
MDRTYRCWQCKNEFVGYDPFPCSVDHICGRCGAGSRSWVPSEEEKLNGTAYWDVGTATVVRLGREHQMLYASGYLKLKTHDKDILEVHDITDFTPSV